MKFQDNSYHPLQISPVDLDPCPTSIIKECVDLLVKLVKPQLLNASILHQGVFPHIGGSSRKTHTCITTVSKKSSWSWQELKNYRTSIQPLLMCPSLLEKVVANQISRDQYQTVFSHSMSKQAHVTPPASIKTGHSTAGTAKNSCPVANLIYSCVQAYG